MLVNTTWSDCKYAHRGRFNASAATSHVFEALDEVCIKVARSPGGKWLGSDAMGGLGCHVANHWQPTLWRRLPPDSIDIQAPPTDGPDVEEMMPYLIPPGPPAVFY